MNRTRNIVKVIAFLVVLVILHALLRQAYYALITPDDFYLQNQKAFSRHADSYDIVVLGDSHSLRGIQPKVIGNVANLSQLGEGYIVRYYKLRYNLRKSPGKLKTIILPMDLHSFSPAWNHDFKMVSSFRYVNHADYLWKYGMTVTDLHSTLHSYIFPYADCTREIHAALPDTRRATEKKRREMAQGRLCDKPITQDMVAQTMTTHYGQGAQWLSDRAVAYLDRIKALCQENNIRVIFVSFPVSGHYLEAASEMIPIDDVDKFAQNVVDEWPGAVLLDYRDLFLDRDDLFFDLNHLNDNGARVFSEILRDDLKTLGVLGESARPAS